VPAQSGGFHTVSLSAGYQLTSRLALGTSLNYWFANWTAAGEGSFRLRVRPSPGARPVDVPLLTEDFHQDQKVRGFNFNAGLLLKYPRLEPRRGGAAALHRRLRPRRERLRGRLRPGQALPAQPIDFDVKTRLHWPLSAGVGAAVRPARGLTLAGDFTHSTGRGPRSKTCPRAALLTPRKLDASGNPEDSFTNRNFSTSCRRRRRRPRIPSQWRAGGEYLVTPSQGGVPLRAGSLPRPLRPSRSWAATRAGDRRTAGTGLNVANVVFDVPSSGASEGSSPGPRAAGSPGTRATAPRDRARDRIVGLLVPFRT